MYFARIAWVWVLVSTAFGAGAAERVVFDRGLNFSDLAPEILLRTPSALFTLDPDAETPTPEIVPGTRDGSTHLMPSWFPDRNRIVYATNRNSGLTAQIWMVDLSSGVHSQLTSNAGNNWAPAVSPDGSRIVFVSTRGVLEVEEGEDPPDPDDPDVAAALRDPRNMDVYIMDLGGGSPIRLTDNGVEDFAPLFSFDGSRVYFVQGGTVPTIRQIPADGTVGDDAAVPDPDGFALTGRDLSVFGDPLGDVMFFTDLRSTFNSYDTFTRILTPGGRNFTRPAISPDGTRLVHTPGGNLVLASFAGDVSRTLLLTADAGFVRWYSSPLSPLPVSIRLIQPNGGETWPRGSTQTIKWQAPAKADDSIKIELSRKGLVPVTLVESTENTGEYEWEIPADQLVSSNYQVTVSFVNDPSVTDTSDRTFSIVSPEACPKPAVPTNVKASDGIYADRIRVTWNTVPGAHEYQVYRTKNLDSWYSSTLVATVEDNMYDDLEVLAPFVQDGCSGPETVYTRYFYYIKAANDCGASGFSESDSGFRGGPVQPLLSSAGNTLVLALAVGALLAAGSRRFRA